MNALSPATAIDRAEQVHFEPASWLATLAGIGGGYALTAERKLSFIVQHCNAEALESVMGEITGRPDRLEAVKRAIQLRQCGEAG